MILSDKDIIKYIKDGLLIEECNINRVQSASIDVTLGNSFKIPYATNKPIKLGSDKPIYLEYSDNCIIEPHSFALGTTKEIVKLPNNIGAFIEGKSSVGRSGIFIQNAGWISPGFEGQITLELYNACNYPIIIEGGMSIGQIIFMKLTSECNTPYIGKYQWQEGATEPDFN
jgi:dCTP deaminase